MGSTFLVCVVGLVVGLSGCVVVGCALLVGVVAELLAVFCGFVVVGCVLLVGVVAELPAVFCG